MQVRMSAMGHHRNHIKYKIANKCLNICELVKVVDRNRDGVHSLPCYLVNRETLSRNHRETLLNLTSGFCQRMSQE